MRSLGRGLQACALVLPLVGLLFGLEGGPGAMTFEVSFVLAGLALFVLGQRLQRE